MNKSFILIILLLFAGCSSSGIMIQESESATEIKYTAVYMVHGDANYTYHKAGQRLQADEEILKEAMSVGETAITGEVFIFHQKPERKRFLFFTGKDREWYHFRGGELVGKGVYSPKGGGFSAEAEIYQEKAAGPDTRKMFLYFGHEVPSKASFSYHQTEPTYEFNTEVFASDITQFEESFDLILLSTCNNGNPIMAAELAGKSRFMIASPRNLHLSYLDTKALYLLEEDAEIPTKALADSIARISFDRLSAQLQTLVTIGVYNMDEVGAYISSYASDYVDHLEKNPQESLFRDNADCRDLQEFASNSIPEKGANVFFKPPAFGREAKMQKHSAWGCKK